MTYEPISDAELLALQKVWASDLPPPHDYEAWREERVEDSTFTLPIGLPHQRKPHIQLHVLLVWLGLATFIVLFWCGVWRLCR